MDYGALYCALQHSKWCAIWYIFHCAELFYMVKFHHDMLPYIKNINRFSLPRGQWTLPFAYWARHKVYQKVQKCSRWTSPLDQNSMVRIYAIQKSLHVNYNSMTPTGLIISLHTVESSSFSCPFAPISDVLQTLTRLRKVRRRMYQYWPNISCGKGQKVKTGKNV